MNEPDIEFSDGIAAVIEVAQDAVGILDLSDDLKAVVARNGNVNLFDIRALDEPFGAGPYRKKGLVNFLTADSFGLYVNEHGEHDHTAIYAPNPQRAPQLVAILNGHQRSPDGSAGWGDHRAILDLPLTDEWQAWNNASGTQFTQQELAEFLEDHVADIVKPSAAELLELARSIEVTSSGAFRSAFRDASGQINFAYDETVAAKAGQTGQLTIPERIELGLVPFDGAERYKVEAKFRYRMTSGTLKLSLTLDRPDIVLRAAFEDAVAGVENSTGLTVLRGSVSS